MIHAVDNDSFDDFSVSSGGYLFCDVCMGIWGINRPQEVHWCTYCGDRGEVAWGHPVLIELTESEEPPGGEREGE
ncbi:MAG: hypothetical protein HC882_09870 [Acidobacteria bacterium]|nr:hypothetical protein [Acidobacteriota bacterium]